MKEIQTQRLVIRRLHYSDADFVLTQLNDASFIRFIGDKGIRNIDNANHYIDKQTKSLDSEVSTGMMLVTLRTSRLPIGICGFVDRPELSDLDLGFAFMPEYWGLGYAQEASQALLELNFNQNKRNCLLAVTKPDNQASISLLKRLGFSFLEQVLLYGEPNNLYKLARNDFVNLKG